MIKKDKEKSRPSSKKLTKGLIFLFRNVMYYNTKKQPFSAWTLIRF